MAAGIYDITIEQGANLSLPLTWKDEAGSPINLTGYSGRMQIRENFDSEDYIVSLTSDVGGGITLGGAAGTITISMSAALTASLAQVDAVYDLELIAVSGFVTRLTQGRVFISREVTR
jgi:hypothetical protein